MNLKRYIFILLCALPLILILVSSKSQSKVTSKGSYTLEELEAMVETKEYPFVSRDSTELVSKAVAPMLCKVLVREASKDVKKFSEYPIEIVEDSKSRYVVRYWTTHSLIYFACKYSENKMELVRYPYL